MVASSSFSRVIDIELPYSCVGNYKIHTSAKQGLSTPLYYEVHKIEKRDNGLKIVSCFQLNI